MYSCRKCVTFRGFLLGFLALATIQFLNRRCQAQPGPMGNPPSVEQVIQINKERIQAFEKGDAAAWGKHVAENCVLIDSVGRVATKAEYVAGIGLPIGYTHTFELLDVHPADFGSTIVLTYRIKELWDFGEQRTGGTNVHTATFARVRGDWQLVSWTETLQPAEPEIAKIDPRMYEKYIGTYAASPKATLTVTKESNKLMGQYAGEEKFELLPAANLTFFRHGDNAALIFVEDTSGSIVEHIYHAPGIEIKYKKVQLIVPD